MMTDAGIKSIINDLKIPYSKDRDVSKKDFTQQKLKLLEKVIYMRLTVRNAQSYINEVVIIDSFSGRWIYFDDKGENRFEGSPLIYLDVISKIQSRPKSKLVKKVKIYLIEKDKKTKELLEKIIILWKKILWIDDKLIEIIIKQGDCNTELQQILKDINHKNTPVFFFVDPYGLSIEAHTMESILSLANKIDVFLNFMSFGVKRVQGWAKIQKGECLFGPVSDLYTEKSLAKKNALRNHLVKFIWPSAVDSDWNIKENADLLDTYKEKFIKLSYEIRWFSVYNKKNSELYVLLYACKDQKILNIIEKFYEDAEQCPCHQATEIEESKKEQSPHKQQSLF